MAWRSETNQFGHGVYSAYIQCRAVHSLIEPIFVDWTFFPPFFFQSVFIFCFSLSFSVAARTVTAYHNRCHVPQPCAFDVTMWITVWCEFVSVYHIFTRVRRELNAREGERTKWNDVCIGTFISEGLSTFWCVNWGVWRAVWKVWSMTILDKPCNMSACLFSRNCLRRKFEFVQSFSE